MSAAAEHMRKLAMAGKGSEARRIISDEAEQTRPRYRVVKEDANLSEAGRRHELAALYRGARRRVESQLARMADRVVLTDRDDAERVFGIKGLSGDVASLTISRRDAADRVVAVGSREELQELLRRATRSGDEVLARAVAERAVEQLDDVTMNQFLADRPELDRPGERLWNAQNATTNSFASTMHLLDLMPSELYGMSEEAIDELAGNAPESASSAVGPLGGDNPW